MSKGYCSVLPKETLLYNIQYHLLSDCQTTEECVERVRRILENFEDKKRNDREDE